MHHFRAGVLAMVMTLALGGCYISVRDGGAEDGIGDETGDWRRRQQRNAEAVSHLELGRRLGSVIDEMGPPDMTESFVRGGQEFRVLFYRTRLVHEDGRLTRDETTPLVFANGQLVGWGETAIDNAAP